jgi:hypothetical protein
VRPVDRERVQRPAHATAALIRQHVQLDVEIAEIVELGKLELGQPGGTSVEIGQCSLNVTAR